MVSPVDSENTQDLYAPIVPEHWEKLGKTFLCASSYLSLSVFIPAAAKKNRVYQPLFLNNGSAAMAEAAPLGEETPHPQHQNRLKDPLFTPRESFSKLISTNDQYKGDSPLYFNIETDEKKSPSFPTCTVVEREKIKKLFSMTASLSLIGLGWNKSELEQLGKDVDEVHTFPFLLAIPKKSMQTIFQKHNRWVIGEILKGIKKGIEKEVLRGQIRPHIPTFAAKMGKEEGKIDQLIHSSNYEGLVRYLFDIN